MVHDPSQAPDPWSPPRPLAGATLSVGTVPADARLRGHAHRAPHLCCVLAGGFRESDGRSVEVLGPGAVRLSPPRGHDLRFAPAGARCLVIELEATPVGVELGRSRFFHDPRLGALALRVAQAVRRTGPSGDLALDESLAELLAQVARHGRYRTPRTPPAWLVRVRDLIGDGHGVHPALEELARGQGVDRAHLARAFRDHYGTTLGSFARRRRLQRGLELLRRSDLPLAAVAAEAGFADQSHLNRALRKATGSTPGQLRRARPRSGTPRA